jgi:hypothetical protein
MSRTVFILGAGASAPYGFPLGTTLLRTVAHKLAQHATVNLFTQYFGQTPAVMRSFVNELPNSGRTSVDAFLEHRPEFMTIVKLGIAYGLIDREIPSELFSDRTGAWLQYLFNRLNRPFDSFGDNQVSFITFNYDRSLEHYLCTCLRNSYGKTIDECASQLKRLPIVHLHGSLGALPWQGNKEAIRDYEPELTVQALKVASENIKVIHEPIPEDDEDFQKAKELLLRAEQVYVLGFGYDATNMLRLGFKGAAYPVAQGTGFGLTDHERGLIMRSIDHRIQIGNFDCIGFLRNVVQW